MSKEVKFSGLYNASKNKHFDFQKNSKIKNVLCLLIVFTEYVNTLMKKQIRVTFSIENQRKYQVKKSIILNENIKIIAIKKFFLYSTSSISDLVFILSKSYQNDVIYYPYRYDQMRAC
ncbi:hypothetical protein BpHYR1_008726 [Brachionus plicatilis]|uniref:Uncharacterized protein n=1 Tax=Brachionus plicatilis TaxID=10195 RepID=A0A3M7SQZ0_BRAPC|nr:hypothetical protein BpHYR1_008726 [Brachionus plicatilis]